MGPFKNAKYGISNRNTSVTVLCDKNYKTEQNMPLGTLVEIKRTFTNGNLEIRVFDYQNPDIWDKNNYTCHKSCLIYIQTDFWPYMTAVSSADDRLYLAKDTKLTEWIVKLKPGDLVAVTGISGDSGLDLECAVIRYRGMVPEIGHGMHFGLELSKENSELATLENLPEPISIKYLNVKSNAVIVSANRIRPVASSRPESPVEGSFSIPKASPKDLAKQLLCGTIQKDKFKHHRASTSSTGLNIITNEHFRRGSLRQTLPHDRKNKDKKYGSSLTLPKSNYNPNESHLISFNRSSSPLRCVSQNSNSMAVGNEKANTNPTLVLTLTPKSMDKNKLPSSSSNPNIVDNNLTQVDEIKPNNSHNESSAAPKHYTSQYDFGDNISIGSTNTYRKPTTIRKALKKSVLSLDERDLIVIDNKDIDTSNAAKNVIVIENIQEKKRNPVYKQEVDLIELLGGNWPDAAGDNLAPILNTDKKIKDKIDNKVILHHTTERNKSMNPLSHFVNERKSVTLEKKTKDVVSRLDKINNDPFGNLGTTNTTASGLYNPQKNIRVLLTFDEGVTDYVFDSFSLEAILPLPRHCPIHLTPTIHTQKS